MSPPASSPSPGPTILLLGPTAGGKTAVSIALASVVPGGGECVIADSMQVYEGMVIGTAQPTPEERAGVPHHLCGTVSPDGPPFTAKDWLDAADAAVADIRGRGRTPILVGGTNLYARAFLEGLFEGPGRDDDVRAELEPLPAKELHERLRAVDAPSADRIHANDRRRMIRALEVHAVSGRPLSEQQREWEDSIAGRPDACVVVLDWPTEVLNRRINARVKAMMADGFLEEVRTLAADDRLGPQAVEAVGYRELRDHLRRGDPLEDAVERIKIRTRRYGKQQRTWLRRFMGIPGAIRLEPVDRSPESLATEILERLSRTKEGDSGPKTTL